MKLSIIIPISNLETELDSVLANLNRLNAGCEILVIAPSNSQDLNLTKWPMLNLTLYKAGNSRASQMNFGAAKALGKYLLFLHADSLLASDALQMLNQSLDKDPTALYYFKLKFLTEKSILLKLNSIGANFRSLVFCAPFGDQGLSISAETFRKLNGFTEDTKYGEDNLLVLKAKKAGIQIKMVKSYIVTSPRKYLEGGWLKITILHQYLWIKQSVEFRLRR